MPIRQKTVIQIGLRDDNQIAGADFGDLTASALEERLALLDEAASAVDRQQTVNVVLRVQRIRNDH